MELIKLKNIGKIYVSENNVNVGIRGVNLSFKLGEFVSITGKSGSGKSTLLNVISGMDTYEEGEMYVEGKETSYYTQNEWEEYRSKYISFVFQEYNIVESFTVLQNVELALINIKNPIERNKKAKELIERVGLTSSINQKGSKLSGGQKQRTVIARALAKDSPIILADEPTGNLDSQSAMEICELLKEISKDKLVIVVTHSFEQFANISTRHIRIHDGAIESDEVLKEVDEVNQEIKDFNYTRKDKISNGLRLGPIMFKSKPKLSIYLILLLMVASLILFAMGSTLLSPVKELFVKDKMFTVEDGRVVLIKKDGSVISEDELHLLQNEYKFKSYEHFDYLIDQSDQFYLNSGVSFTLKFVKNKEFGKAKYGTYPSDLDEVFLYLPISAKREYGSTSIGSYINFYGTYMKISGIKYFYDNTKTAYAVLTEDGYLALSYAKYLRNKMNVIVRYDYENDGTYTEGYIANIMVVKSWTEDKWYNNDYSSKAYLNSKKDEFNDLVYDCTLRLQGQATGFYGSYTDDAYYYVLSKALYTEDSDGISRTDLKYYNDTVFISYSLLKKLVNDLVTRHYVQASIYFNNDASAKSSINKINESNYIGVLSNTKIDSQDIYSKILLVILGINVLVVVVGVVLFLGLFISLCTYQALEETRSDIAIMRSMGIDKYSIKLGVYFRLFICLIPSFILIALVAFLVYTSPVLNGFFNYMHLGTYLLLVFALLIIIYRVTRNHVKRLFSSSVKKNLRGGTNNA